jgi:5'-3' exoribonuclease 1
MGIPRFFKWISESYPETVMKTSFGNESNDKTIQSPDCLYLDANGIIHNAVRDVFFPAPVKRFAPKRVKSVELTREQKEKLVFKNICNYMGKLYTLIKPGKLFYIAIDGTAPVAKQAQQRQRRYKSAEDKTQEEFDTFDTNAITPGTAFLKRLTRYIEIWVSRQKLNCEIRFSPPTEPGEGEHKLMDYIRDHRNLTHMVYGLDADLFMLTLTSNCRKIYLLREDIFNVSSFDTFFHVVDVASISKQLWETNRDKYGVEITQKQFIQDFVFYCFLVGNDFLHNIPSLWDLEGSIDMMLTLDKSGPLIDSPGIINREHLIFFFKQIAEREDKLLASQLRTRRFENKALNAAMKNKLDKREGIDLNVFRVNYYKKAKVKSNDDVLKFCRRYLQGLGWVSWYYNRTPKNWRWIFPYHFSPLITDLVVFLESVETPPKEMFRVKNPALTAEQQLMCVIPPRSVKLLPAKLRKLYKNNELVEYYPENFERDLSGKLRDWEAIALLPFIDLKVLLPIVDEIC